MLQDQLKRFFYRMKITSFDGQHVAELTPEILRLIVDVTISESSYSDAGETYPTLTLTLNEASYLTESAILTPDASSSAHGQLTNRPGSILDIRFDSEKGFTYVSKEEMESGITRNKRTQSSVTQPVVFLFQGNNKIEIEWGLLQPKKSRVRQFTISTLSVSGGGSGNGTVTITALDGTHLAKKTSIDKGIPYVHADANHTPYSLKQTLFTVCKVLDYDLEFDGARVAAFPPFTSKFVAVRTEVGGDTAPEDPKAPIMQPSQFSMHEFVKKLANDYSSSYEYDTDPQTKRTVLKFQYREVRYASADLQFTYRSQNDVVLNYKIDSVEGSFNPVTGVSGVADEGENNAIYTQVQTVKQDTKLDGKQTANLDKVLPAYNPADKARVKDNLGRKLVTQNETSPSNSPEAINNHAASLYSKNQYNSTISLTTLGDPDYKPGLIQMNNIGLRYSKKYRMFTVQHKLGSSGYTCSWSGVSHYAAEGGVSADEVAKDNQESTFFKVVDKNNKK